MSQSVDRLKELLFDTEANALQELAQRIDGLVASEQRTREDLARRFDGIAESGKVTHHDLVRRIDGMAEIDAKARDELKSKIEEVYARAGNSERMTASVSEILSEALRRAEIDKHSELSQSIAPLVVTTIKTELRNSQDEMVEALYPITGRLVQAYVASAIKDLTDQMNRRLEQNPVMLRLQSLTTGRSVGELALTGTQDFDVKELYLIRRGSGELVARWPDSPISGRDHAMSGVLAAVNEFANEAFSADQASLRQIDIGDEEVYLRGSPVYLLAARCSGQAPLGIEQSLDDVFLSAVEAQHRIDAEPAHNGDRSRAKIAALADVGIHLKNQIANETADLRRPAGKGALKVLAALIMLPLFAWLAWGWFSDYRIASVHSTTERIIAADPAMLGYPTEIDVTASGRNLSVSGLTPSQQAKTRIVGDLRRSLPGVALIDKLSVVAGSGVVVPDVSPELARLRQEMNNAVADVSRGAVFRTGTRAERRLAQAESDLTRAAAGISNKAETDALKRNLAEIGSVLAEKKQLSETIGDGTAVSESGKLSAAFQTLALRLDGLSDDLVRSMGGDAPAKNPIKSAKLTASDAVPLDIAVEQFAADSERVAALASMVAVAKSLRPPAPIVMAAPPAAPVPAAQPSPREQLEAFARSHAIFFAANSDYRNPDASSKTIADLSQLLKASPTLIRIVGYTDEVGGQSRNGQLAQDRADKIRRELVALGVPASQIVSVGRANAIDLSDTRGAMSPNRRVEFELGFEGEALQ